MILSFSFVNPYSLLLDKEMATCSSVLAWRIPETGGLLLDKEMATHSSVLAWRIPGTGGLPSMGSYRVGHD